MDEHKLSMGPSGDFLFEELEYLREFEGDLIEPPPSATQSLGHSDCGRPAPSLSFPSFAPTPRPPAEAPSEYEETILREWEKLQKIRVAASRAAEIARSQADEVARLQSALTIEENNTTNTTNPIDPSTKFTANGTSEHPESMYMEERIVQWPPNAQSVPVTYNLAEHNAPVLRARAKRVEELGSYFVARTKATEDEEEAVKEAAKKVGDYQNLAKALRQQLSSQQQRRQ
jgi:hypothetical protein